MRKDTAGKLTIVRNEELTKMDKDHKSGMQIEAWPKRADRFVLINSSLKPLQGVFQHSNGHLNTRVDNGKSI